MSQHGDAVQQAESCSASSGVEATRVEPVFAEMTEYSPSSGDGDAPCAPCSTRNVPWYAQWFDRTVSGGSSDDWLLVRLDEELISS